MTEQREPLKRVVLMTRDGINHIIGTFDPSVHTLRDFIEFKIVRNGRAEPVGASLITVKTRFVLYRETMAHATMGRLGEFHPQQR